MDEDGRTGGWMVAGAALGGLVLGSVVGWIAGRRGLARRTVDLEQAAGRAKDAQAALAQARDGLDRCHADLQAALADGEADRQRVVDLKDRLAKAAVDLQQAGEAAVQASNAFTQCREQLTRLQGMANPP